MRSIFVALLLALPAVAAADKNITDKSAKIDCAKDPKVSINTGEGTFTFTGKCELIAINGGENKVKIESVTQLLVNGAENTVDVEAVDKIQVNGNDNKVNYKKGVTTKAPKTASIGTGNKLTLVK
jgi:hypothetical protein